MKQRKLLLPLVMAIVMMAMSPTMAWAISGSGTSSSPYQISSASDWSTFRTKVNDATKGTVFYAKLTSDITISGSSASVGTSSKPFYGEFNGNGKTITLSSLSGSADNVGLFGYVTDAHIHDLTLKGSMSSSYNQTGSVVGNANGTTKLYDIYSSVNITMGAAKSHIGGIVGQANGTVEIKGCTYAGSMSLGSCSDSNGGIVGFCVKNAKVDIQNCAFTGSMTTSASSPRLGGILGYADDDGTNFVAIKYCFYKGTLSPSTGTDVGIFAGCPRGNVPKVIKWNNYMTDAETNLVGNNYHSTVSASSYYNTKIKSVSVTSGTGGSVSWEFTNPTSTTPTRVKATASASTGYHFTQWQEKSTSTVYITRDATYEKFLESNITLYARFDAHSYTVASSTKVKDATCTVAAKYRYKCSCGVVEQNDSHLASVGSPKGHGHTKGYTPTYTWGGTYSSPTCKFTLKCLDCSTTVVSNRTLTTTEDQTNGYIKKGPLTAATCTTDGSQIYWGWGKYSDNYGSKYSDDLKSTYEKSYTIPKTGHGNTKGYTPTYTWGGTYSSPTCTFTLKCLDCNKDIVSNESLTTTSGTYGYYAKSTTTAAKCTTDGSQLCYVHGKFTDDIGSKVFNDSGDNISNKKSYPIPAIGHGNTKGYSATYTWSGTYDAPVCKFTLKCGDCSTNVVSAKELTEAEGDYGSYTKGTQTAPTCSVLGSLPCTANGKYTDATSKKSYTESGSGVNRTHPYDIPMINHDFASQSITETYLASAATCTHAATYYYYCSRCSAKGTETFFSTEDKDKALGHDFTSQTTEQQYLESAATCTEAATYYYKCSRCSEMGTETYTSTEDKDKAKGHTAVTDAAVEASCTETGLTEGSHCSVCKAVIVAQESTPAKGHTAVTDAAVEATCTETGLTEGSHCSLCETVNVAQETIPAKGHNTVKNDAVVATCGDKGNTEHWKCTACGKLFSNAEGTTETTLAAVTTNALGHKYDANNKCTVCQLVVDPAQAVRLSSTASSGTSGYSGENYDKLFDGNTSTKWCLKTDNPFVEFSTSELVYVTGYSFTTGNDTWSSSSRNPKTWKLSAKSSPSDAWEVIDSKSNDETLKAENEKEYQFALSKPTALRYQYFRLEFTHSGTMQLSEISLFGCNERSLCAHSQALTHHEEVPATCTTAGTREYWSCPDCNKMFSSATASAETMISDTSTPKLPHTVGADGKCSVCGATGMPYLAPTYNTPGDASSGIASWTTAYVASNVTTITSTSTTLSAGWYLISDEVTITKRITCNGAVHLILAPGSKLTAYAGITVSGNDNSLTIYGQPDGAGELIATGGTYVAGIGGGYQGSGSNITINGGTVTARGGDYAAGIGGGYDNSGSNITINGGTVTATGGKHASGIGGGEYGSGSDITINDGTVTATGGVSADGIGGGYQRSGSTIFISTSCGVLAGTSTDKTVVTNDGSDLASKLNNKQYVVCIKDYTRTLTTEWETLAVPFAVTITDNDNYEFYSISGVDGSDLLINKATGTLAAGAPVLVHKKVEGPYNLTLTASNKDVSIGISNPAAMSGLTLKGIYAKASVAAGAGYVFDGSKFVKTTEATDVAPFHAYLAGAISDVDAITPQMHVHSTVQVDAVAATCDNKGNIEHWKCTVCYKLLSNAEGTNETTLEAVTIAKAHNWSDDSHTYCTKCNRSFIYYTAKNKVIPYTPASLSGYDDSNNTYDSETQKGVIEFPSKLTSIGQNAFNECHGLQSITIPSSVTSIDCAFLYCTGLQSITIPSSVTSIGNYEFNGCTSLKNVAFNSIPQLGYDMFSYCEDLNTKTLTLTDDSYVAADKGEFPTLTKAPTFTRTLTTELETIVVPFAITYKQSNADYKLYQLVGTSVAEISIDEYDDNATIPAGTPMLIKAIGSQNASGKYEVTLTANGYDVSTTINTPAAISGLTLTGTYAKASVAAGAGYVFNGTQFVKTTVSTDVAPFHAYLAGAIADVEAITLQDHVHSIAKVDAKTATCGDKGNIEHWKCTVCYKLFSDAEGKTETTLAAVTTTEPHTWSDDSHTYCTACDHSFIYYTASDKVTPYTPASLSGYDDANNTYDSTTKQGVIELTSKLTSIGYMAFNECFDLQSVTIPDGVTSIGYKAFNCCTNLQSVTIPRGVTSIGKGAFTSCHLYSLTIPSSVTSIGIDAFYECTSLKDVAFNSIPQVGGDSFCACNKLNTKTLTLTDDSYVAADKGNFPMLTAQPTCTRTLTTEWETIVVPFAVTYKQSNADYKLYQLIGTSAADISIIEYDDNATIPAGTPMLIKAIGSRNASGKYEVTLTANGYDVSTTINNPAAISDLTLTGTYAKAEVATGAGYVFNGTQFVKTTVSTDVAPFHAYLDGAIADVEAITLQDHVHSIAKVDAKTATCGDKGNIEHWKCTVCGKLFSDAEGKTETTLAAVAIAATGKHSYSDDTKTYCTTCNHIFINYTASKKVTPETPASLSGYDDANNTYDSETKQGVIELPSKLTSIGKYAFAGCAGLQSITIPSSVTSIGVGALSYCTNLQSITIPGSVTSLGNYTFDGCTSLKNVAFNSIPQLGYGMFDSCDKLNTKTLALTDDSYVAADKGYFPTLTAQPTFTHEMTTEWETLVVPFAITYKQSNTDYKLYRLIGTSAADISIVEYDDNATIPAGTPMLIKAIGSRNASGKYEVTLSGAANEEGYPVSTTINNPAAFGDLTLTGTYAKASVATGAGYVFDGTQFVKTTVSTDVAPFHAYLDGAIDDVDAITPQVHVHNIAKVDAVAATHSDKGNIDHWKCSVCGTLFSDEACTKETTLAAVTINAGHQFDANNKCTVCQLVVDPAQAVRLSSTASSGTSGFSGEDYDKLFDGNTSTKWCLDEDETNPFVEFSTSGLVYVTGYSFTTGDDTKTSPWRNPETWKLFAKSSPSGAWEVIDSKSDDDTLEDVNEKEYQFELSKPTALSYQYFRLEFTHSGTMQLSEISLYGISERSLCTHSQLTHHDEVSATCTATGNKAYWKCTVCGMLFSDAEGTAETTLEAVTIARAHNWSDDTHTACTACDHSFINYTASQIVTPGLASLKGYDDANNTFNSTTGQGVIELPSKLTSIGNGVFMGCSSLQSITIPNSVTSIDSYAIFSCHGLSSIAFNSIPMVEGGAFNECPNLHTKTLTLTDDSYVAADKGDFPTLTAQPTFTRTLTTEWETIMVPFAVTITDNDNYEFYTISGVDGSNLQTTKATGTLAAGTPVLIRKKVEGQYKLILTADDTDVSTTINNPAAVSGLTLTGTYAKAEVATGAGYVFDGYTFVKATKATTVAPFHAYLDGAIDGVDAIKLPGVIIPGDLNDDGLITISDLTLLVQLLNAGGTITNPAADVDKDGSVDIDDVNALRNKLLGK